MSTQNPKVKRKKRNRKQYQAEHLPIMDMLIGSGEIHLPSGEDYVAIPMTEYAGLVANNALLAAAKRIIEDGSYPQHNLRVLLGMEHAKPTPFNGRK